MMFLCPFYIFEKKFGILQIVSLSHTHTLSIGTKTQVHGLRRSTTWILPNQIQMQGGERVEEDLYGDEEG